MTHRVLLTGATGYVGRHVLETLLAGGAEVTAIVRRRSGKVAERLPASPRLRVLQGDVTSPFCGLAAETRDVLRGKFEAMVHAAGLTQFDAGLEAELRLQNVGGTLHAHDLAVDLGIPQFHHVSTAFVVGNGDGTFKNPYEKSKADADAALLAREGPVLSIYRPSIVVGGRVLGDNGTAGTLYAYLKALRFIRECFRRDSSQSGKLSARYGASSDRGTWTIPLRVEGDARTSINLVHAHEVAGGIAAGVFNPPPAIRIRALVSRESYPASRIKEVFCRRLGLEGVEWVPAYFLDERANPLEEKFRRMTNTYRCYLFNMPRLESAEGSAPVDLDAVVGEFLAEFDKKEGPARRLGALAVDSLEIEKPSRYLDKFSGGDFGESLLKRIDFMETRVQFRILGDDHALRTIFFDKGKVRAVDNAERPDFSYELEQGVFRKIISGELDPREAFFKGLLKITGDQERALKFGYLFTEHFMDIDNRILEELEGKNQ